MSAPVVLSALALVLLAMAMAGRAAPSSSKLQSRKAHQRPSHAHHVAAAGPSQEKENSNTGASGAKEEKGQRNALRAQKRTTHTEAPTEQDDLFEFDDMNHDSPASDDECAFLNDSDRFSLVLQEEMRQNSGNSLKVCLFPLIFNDRLLILIANTSK